MSQSQFSIIHQLAHYLGRPTVALDYPGLRIVAHSPTERFIRAHSAKKEPETVAWLESLPRGAVLWDVGANIGAYSLIAASLKLQVVAFEPSPLNFASLCENVELNAFKGLLYREDLDRYPWILPVSAALGDFNGPLRLQCSKKERGAALHQVDYCSGYPIWMTTGEKAIEAGLPAPQYLKIDTDGGEEHVINGLGKYLEGVQSFMVEMQGLIRFNGFEETGRWPIPGFSLQNRLYQRVAK